MNDAYECPCDTCKQCRAECDHCGCYAELQAKYERCIEFIKSAAEFPEDDQYSGIYSRAKRLLEELK